MMQSDKSIYKNWCHANFAIRLILKKFLAICTRSFFFVLKGKCDFRVEGQPEKFKRRKLLQTISCSKRSVSIGVDQLCLCCTLCLLHCLWRVIRSICIRFSREIPLRRVKKRAKLKFREKGIYFTQKVRLRTVVNIHPRINYSCQKPKPNRTEPKFKIHSAHPYCILGRINLYVKTWNLSLVGVYTAYKPIPLLPKVLANSEKWQ